MTSSKFVVTQPSNLIVKSFFKTIFFLVLATVSVASQAQSVPASVIPIGDGPYALDLSADGRSAIISLLFPAEDNDPNLFLVDLESKAVTGNFRFGRRLFRIGAVDPSMLNSGSGNGLPVVLVNGDVDKLTMVELSTSMEVAQVRTGQNPSNVEIIQSATNPVIGNAQNLAVVTNGTGNSLSLIDLDNLTQFQQIKVGGDPRATAMLPGSKYIAVALRAENALTILDLTGPAEIARVTVGQDPTDVKVTPNGQFAVVANLTNNSISIVDISNPSNPTVVRNPKSNGLQLPVGEQPTSIAITPDSTRAFVANAGSSWITVVDLINTAVEGVLRIQQPGSALAATSAAVRITPDGSDLLVAESGNNANLFVYDIATLNLEPLPQIEVPDEPGTHVFLERTGDEPCGFYTAALTLQDRAEEGFWGMEVLTTEGNRLLEGGINLGGAFDSDASNPGFGAFNIANKGNENQIVKVSVEASAIPTEGFSSDSLGLSVQIVDSGRNPVTDEFTGSSDIEFEAELAPGFYIVRIKSLPGSPRGTFLMGMTTRFVDRAGGGFQGGANVGGFITRSESGNSTKAFAGFCLSQSQSVAIRSEAGTTRGPSGAGNLVLTIKNRSRDVVQEISNSVPPAPPVVPPAAPSLDGLSADIHVDASGRSSGTGTSSNPFRSITQAVGKAARSGDVIIVRPGIYSPSTTGEVLPIGSPGPGLNRIPSGVTLIGSGAADTIIDAESALRDGSPVNAMGIGSDNVRVAGFTVRGSSAVGIFILGADKVQIDSNFFVGNGRFAVGASDSNGLVIRNNVARANNETGFSVANAQLMNVANPPPGCPPAFGACVINNIANEHSRDGFLFTTGGDYHILSNTALNNGISGIEVNNRNNLRPLDSVVRGNLTSNNGGVLFPFSGTGILITEFAHATELSENQANNNRPGGIAVFEDSSATDVSGNLIRNSKQNGLIIQKRSSADSIFNNQIVNSGLAGIFVENNATVGTISGNIANSNGTCSDCTAGKGGIAILGESAVGAIKDNSFDRNSLGMQIASSSLAESVTDSSFDNNDSGGVLLRVGSAVSEFRNNTVRNNRGAIGFSIQDSTAQISHTQVSSREGVGVALFDASNVTIESSTISDSALDGITVFDGSVLKLISSEVVDNGEEGVLASAASTDVTVHDSAVSNNKGYGLSAQNDAKITCTGTTTVSGNGLGETLGNVEGCN